MSVFSLAWAFQQEVFPASDKFVLCALCNFAGDKGIVYPALSTISQMTSLTEPTISKSLEALVRRGFLIDTGKKAGKTQRITVYRLPDAALGLQILNQSQSNHKEIIKKSSKNTGISSGQEQQTTLAGSITCDEPSSCQKTAQPGTRNQEPVQSTPIVPKGDGVNGLPKDLGISPERFEQACQIYDQYPRKVGRPTALRSICRQLKNHPFELLMERTKAFAAIPRVKEDMQYVPHPSTWFNQERFNDDPSTWERGSRQPSSALKLKVVQEEITELKDKMQYDWDRTPERVARMKLLREQQEQLRRQIVLTPPSLRTPEIQSA